MRIAGEAAALAARNRLSVLSICLGAAALAATAAVVPASAEDATPAVDPNQPMTLIVSLSQQKVDVYRGMSLVTSSRVSTGKRGHATKAGVFSILEKQRHHYSNMYGGAPMPWMNRITWSGTALHAGVVPGYPASHGCIRLPYSFAPKLFQITTVGEHVIVAHGKVAPELIEHPALFQPLPPPEPPVLAEDHKQHTNRQSINDAVPAFGSGLPVVLAKAETSTTVTDMPPETEIPASTPVSTESSVHAPLETPLQRSVMVSAREDTRVHAIDPSAGPFIGSGAHAVAAKPSGDAAQGHASVSTSDDFVKHQDRLAAESAPIALAPAADSSESSAPDSTTTGIETIVSDPQGTTEPQAGPILTVAATVLARPVPAPVPAVIVNLGPPPLPPTKPSVIAAKLTSGAAAAAVEAAEPLSTEPLRILVTRSTKRDRLRAAQYALSSMGYLEPQNFDGSFGRLTIDAIKAFQKANDMPQTGAFTDDVAKKIYAAAGQEEPPQAHLFVRQKFDSVFDAPVSIKNPDEPLGTHLFTVMHFAPGDTKAQWMAFNLSGEDDSMAVLDRLEIPDDVRRNISERLTPGSSLIIAETAINSATLPKGADFLVWDTSKPAPVTRASVKPAPTTRRVTTTRRRSTSTSSQRYQSSRGWPFF